MRQGTGWGHLPSAMKRWALRTHRDWGMAPCPLECPITMEKGHGSSAQVCPQVRRALTLLSSCSPRFSRKLAMVSSRRGSRSRCRATYLAMRAMV